MQLVKFCVTEGQHGRPDTVQVWDESQPFAWVAEAGQQMEPTPNGLPTGIEALLPK